MPTVRVDHANVWYEKKGKGEPLTLIGGFALLDDQWTYCMEHLEPHYEVINWHYRGSGRADWAMAEPFSIERWVDDLKGILDDAGIERTHIWATSTGSVLGIRFAAKYPERTGALITYPWFRSDDTWKRIFSTAYEVAATFGMASMARLFAGAVLPPDLLYADEGIQHQQWTTEVFETNVNIATLKNVMDAYSNVDLASDVASLSCPVLLLMGNESALNQEDALTAASFDVLVESFRKLKPDAEVRAIPGAGSSYCMMTKPKECCDELIDYLRNHAFGS